MVRRLSLFQPKSPFPFSQLTTVLFCNYNTCMSSFTKSLTNKRKTLVENIMVMREATLHGSAGFKFTLRTVHSKFYRKRITKCFCSIARFIKKRGRGFCVVIRIVCLAAICSYSQIIFKRIYEFQSVFTYTVY